MPDDSVHAPTGPAPAGTNLYIITEMREAPPDASGLADRLASAGLRLPGRSDELLALLAKLNARIFLPLDAGRRASAAPETPQGA
jgi:hypothetical protein